MRWWKATVCGSNLCVGEGVRGSRSSRSAAGRRRVGSGSWRYSRSGVRGGDRGAWRAFSVSGSVMELPSDGAAPERVDVLRRRTGPTPEDNGWCGGSSGRRDRSATSHTSTRSGAHSTWEIQGRESKNEGPKAAEQSGRVRRRRDERDDALCVRRRFVELHEDDALDNWGPTGVS